MILELIFTNKENMILACQDSGLGKSDHAILKFNFNCYTKNSSATFKKYNFNKGNYNIIEEENWHESMQDLSLAESWEYLTDKQIRLNIWGSISLATCHGGNTSTKSLQKQTIH